MWPNPTAGICQCQSLLSYALWNVKTRVIVSKNNGTQSWRLLSFLLLRLSFFLITFYLSFSIYFAVTHPHSALLVVDNWTVVEDLISRRHRLLSFCFVFVIFSPRIPCLAVRFLLSQLFICLKNRLNVIQHQPLNLQKDGITKLKKQGNVVCRPTCV
jgi:uncharacterized membrane protein YpjA